jgi:hypothetical protein
MTASKRHHYLPQFYLKGFVNNIGRYYLFDKDKEEIRESTPSNSFYQNHRNTGSVGDEKMVLLEDMYAHIESETAPHYQKLINVTSLSDVESETFIRVINYIHYQYWRIPQNDKQLEMFIDKLSFAETGFDIKDKAGNSAATPELQQQLKSIDVFRKMYRMFIPILSGSKQYQKNDFENWRLYTRGNRLQLTGDSPVIIDKFIDFGSLNEELIFPLAGDKILIHTKRPKPKNLPSKFLLQLDMLLLQQADRYVCCADKQYLEILINDLYSFSKHHDLKDHMKTNIFGHFK